MIIRPARPEDADAVAKVHVRAWQAAYRGLLPDEYLASLRAEERARRYTFGSSDPLAPATLVAVDGTELIGFATTAPARDPDCAGQGELAALHVDPGAWGRGVGRALIAAARAQLVDRGHTGAILWVMVGNSRAEQFYRHDGWLPDGARRTDQVWGATVDELRFRRRLP
ncbi:MAG: GNAT family N-acetyltransferase [Hyalangium sp.]|uniref:GNAT family N-acetyltransferase n=1 Tax=Hyalangium sp. TaxID=2028555 RepID=UPI003899E01A